MAFIKEMTTPASMPKALNRTNALPLDSSAVWYSLEELQTYAREGATAYVGQIVSLVDQEANTSVAYMIANTAGDLVQVGAVEDEGPVVNPTLGDNASVVVENDVAKLYDFGKAYYRWDEENEIYVRQEVSEEHPWKAELEARVVEHEGTLVLGWFEVSPVLQDELDTVAGEVDDVKTAIVGINKAISDINTAAGTMGESLADVEDAVAGLQDELDGYVDEDGQQVPGIKKDIENLQGKTETLETNVVNLQTAIGNVYTKEETNELVAGLFHFKDVVDELPESAEEGDVYQVGDAEWVWNGENWVELGLTVDLTNYATKDHVAQQLVGYATETYVGEQLVGYATEDHVANKLADYATKDLVTVTLGDYAKTSEVTSAITSALSPVLEQIEANKSALEGLSSVNGSIAALEKTVGDHTAELTSVRGDISDLKSAVGTAKNGDVAGTGLIGRVDALETYINDLTAVGGQPNVIEKIFAGDVELAVNEKAITIPVYNGTIAGLVPVMNSSFVAENKTAENYALNGAGQWSLMEDSRIGNLTIDDETYNTVEAYIAKYLELHVSENIYWEQIKPQ